MKKLILTITGILLGVNLSMAGCQNWIKITKIANLRYINSADKSVSWTDIHFQSGFKGVGFSLPTTPTPYNAISIYSNAWSTPTYNTMIASLLSAQATGQPVYFQLSIPSNTAGVYTVVDYGTGDSSVGLDCNDFSGGAL